MAYHGAWNFSAAGQAWWKNEATYSAWLSYPTGFLEIACAFSYFFKIRERIASVIVMVLMSGAVIEHLKNGYSYKQNGFEVALAYGLVAASVAFKKS